MIEKPIMFRTTVSCKTLVVVLLLLLAESLQASAHLNGDISSIAADARAVQASVRKTALVSYEVHEFQSSAGLTVREYVTRSGSVFALSWSGVVPPDLHQLLGPEFPAYAAAVAALPHPGLHRAVRVAQEGLVVQLSGHPRSYSGHAYVPALLPADFDVRVLH